MSITLRLMGANQNDPNGEGATFLALNQLFELVQVKGGDGPIDQPRRFRGAASLIPSSRLVTPKITPSTTLTVHALDEGCKFDFTESEQYRIETVDLK